MILVSTHAVWGGPLAGMLFDATTPARARACAARLVCTELDKRARAIEAAGIRPADEHGPGTLHGGIAA